MPLIANLLPLHLHLKQNIKLPAPLQNCHVHDSCSAADLMLGFQADMREMVEAEKNATAIVKALKSDLTTEKQQHEDQVCLTECNIHF